MNLPNETRPGVEPWWPWAVLLAGALGLYAAYWTHFYPGFFGDDAAYLLEARSLLQGSFRGFYLLNSPVETHFLPGFSLVLSPFVMLLPLQSPFLRLIPILSTLAASVWMAIFFRRWLSPALTFLAVFFFAMNPVTALYSSTFLSDSFFAMMVLATLCLFAKVAESDAPGWPWGLAVVMSWTVLTRPVGAILFVAVGGGALFLEPRRKKWWISLGIPLLCWALWLVRTHAVSGQANNYLSFWGKEFSSLSSMWVLVRNFFDVIREIEIVQLLNLGTWVWPGSMGGSLFTFVAVGVGLFGIRNAYRDAPSARPLLIAAVIFTILYLAVHGLWLTFEDRYALPLLPFLLAFFILGVDGLLARTPLRAAALPILFFGLGSGLVAEHVVLIRETFSAERPVDSKPPRETMQWLKEQTPPDEIICARSLSRLYLFTGRVGVGEPMARDSEEAQYLLRKIHVRTILLEGGNVLSLSGNSSANQAAAEDRFVRWVRGSPELYLPTYENKNEGTAIFTLRQDDAFLNAYTHYVAARTAFSESGPDAGFAELDQALAIDPTLASALSLYGAALLAQGRDLPRSGKLLRRALTLEPNHPPTELQLARLALAQHHFDEARRWLVKTRESLDDPSSAFHFLMPTIDALDRSIPNRS